MDNKMIAAMAVGLLLIVAIPFLLNAMQSKPAPEAAAPPKPATPLPPPPPAPVIWQGVAEPPPKTMPQYMRQAQEQSQSSGPALTAETLVGTAWEVGTPYGVVQVEVGPNGTATFNHPMVGALQGNWTVQGNKVNVSASFMGQTQNISATIQGNTLQASGQSIRRLR